jgi:predicted dehydrogenase
LSISLLASALTIPRGQPDRFDVCFLDEDKQWQTLPIEGTWFPDAFIGTMASVMRAAEDATLKPQTAVDDAVRTMALVEAAYESSDRGSTAISYDGGAKHSATVAVACGTRHRTT